MDLSAGFSTYSHIFKTKKEMQMVEKKMLNLQNQRTVYNRDRPEKERLSENLFLNCKVLIMKKRVCYIFEVVHDLLHTNCLYYTLFYFTSLYFIRLHCFSTQTEYIILVQFQRHSTILLHSLYLL